MDELDTRVREADEEELTVEELLGLLVEALFSLFVTEPDEGES